MPVHRELQYAPLDQLMLDPQNPRLGRASTKKDLQQSDILEIMKEWTLDELATSFLESGFWPHEAVLVVKETYRGKLTLIVVEGNRRIAALKFLKAAIDGNPSSPRWEEIADGAKPPKDLFSRIPYIEVDNRKDIDAFLGFRHVTGIKEWRPAEKAEYISKLIDERHMSYAEVTRKIGSKVPTVRKNYIAYRVLCQMEDAEDISLKHVEEKFSVLYLSLRTDGVQKYLKIDIKADPRAARLPVPKRRMKELTNFALWLFGNDDREPLFSDSRKVDTFGTILESPKAIEYLERTDKPSFEVAVRMAGGDEPELVNLIEGASDNVELALTRIHLYLKSKKLRSAISRLMADTNQLFKNYPSVRLEVEQESSGN